MRVAGREQIATSSVMPATWQTLASPRRSAPQVEPQPRRTATATAV